MIEDIPTDICDLITSALDDKIENFIVEKHQGNEKGQGFLGEVFYLSLKNKKTGQDHHLVIKQVLAVSNEDSIDLMSNAYKNEIHFYKKVFPTFRQFQQSHLGSEIFKNVPECYATSLQRGKEKLVLENLKFRNYEMHPKHIPVTTKMYETIFKLYGKYHGVSFALKTADCETFFKLGNGFINQLMKFIEKGFMMKYLEDICIKIELALENENEIKLVEKFKKYTTNGTQLLMNSITHKSPYEVIVHGDCWSNNMMFKYSKSRDIEDIKMLDFQLSMLASPVLDLSYSFYSGAAKENLDKLEYFLQIYYKSLGDTLKEFKLDVEKIYPYDAMKTEWKDLTSFGFIMGLIIWVTKNSDAEEVPNVGDIMDNKNEESVKVSGDKFKTQCINLIRHMDENNFL